MADYDKLLGKYGVTADQVRGMSDSQLAPFAKKEGFTVSQVRSFLGAASPPAASSAAAPGAASAAKSTVQEGFGGLKQWDVLKDLAVGPADVSTLPGMEMLPQDELGRTTEAVEGALADFRGSLDKMSAANESLLKGEIPADVSAAVRRAASENSILAGVRGQASRALSARDLGLTSMDIQQKGIANEVAIAEAKQAYAAAHENIRQYNATRNAALAELSIKARQQNLSAVESERMRVATNIESNLNIMKLISDMRIQQQSLATQAASNKIDPVNVIASMDDMIAQFSAKLY